MVYISGGNELINPQEVFKHLELKPGEKVADLGCGGAGHFVIPAGHQVGPQSIVYAVDILKSVLQSVMSRARLEGLANVKPVWTNLEIVGATKIPAESLDAAFLINILFQSKQHDNIFQEAIRLLKKDGRLLVIDWQAGGGTFGPPAVDRVKPATVKAIAQKLRLTLVEEFAAGTYHYGLIFSK